MQFFRILFLIGILTIAAAPIMAQPDSLLHVDFAKRHEYVFKLEKGLTDLKDPNQALDSLQRMIDRLERAGDDAFAYQIGFIRIFINGYMDDIMAREKILKSIEEGTESNFTYEVLEAKNNLAKYYWGKDDRTQAMELGLGAYKEYKDLTIEVFPARIEAQRTLAIWYYTFKDYSKAKELISELLAIPSLESSKHYAPSSMLLGLCYRELDELDSSLAYFKKAFNCKNGENRNKNRALAAGNIGSVYYFKKEYDNAIEWAKIELDIWREENGNKTFASFSSYTAISEFYLKTGNLAMAKAYIDSAYQLKDVVRRNYSGFQLYYTAKCRILEASGDYRSALAYKDSVLMMTDSMNRVKNIAQIVSAEKSIAEVEHKKELVFLKAMRRSSVWIRNVAIVAILCLAIIAFLLINRNRLKLKQQELLAIAEKNHAENRLLIFTKEFQAKNSQIAELKEELSVLSDEKELSDKNEAIIKLQQSTILTDEQWDEFRILFEQVYAGFIGKLKIQFPGLTPAELRYLTLLKLQLSNKEMANILGVSMNTVHNYKSRMRRKFTISDDTDFESIISLL